MAASAEIAISSVPKTKKNVHFVNEIFSTPLKERPIPPKPLQVFSLASSAAFTQSLAPYFFEEDIVTQKKIKDERQQVDSSHFKNTSVYIVFTREDISLNYMLEAKAYLDKARLAPPLKIIEIVVQRGKLFKDYIDKKISNQTIRDQTIEALKSAYKQENEPHEATSLKNLLAASLKDILNTSLENILKDITDENPKKILTEADKEALSISLNTRKKVAVCDLIRDYIAINHFSDEIPLYYDQYQSDIREIEKDCQERMRNLLKKSFRNLDDVDKESNKIKNDETQKKRAKLKECALMLQEKYHGGKKLKLNLNLTPQEAAPKEVSEGKEAYLESPQMFFHTKPVKVKEEPAKTHIESTKTSAIEVKEKNDADSVMQFTI